MGKTLEFLLDSGASHNFLPRSVVKRFGFVTVSGPRAWISLADSSHLYPQEYLHISVDFGPVAHSLAFTVLDVDCPLILGMPFLSAVNPRIDWIARSVIFIPPNASENFSS